MKDAPLPPDDASRRLAYASPDTDPDTALPHLAIAGDTYTTLISGKDTAGRYCLIDMLVARGGGPPPHRHDFEEMFHVLDGAIEATFRGKTLIVKAGETINIPANAPHAFKNVSPSPARLICMCTPAGQEELFALVGDAVPTRTSPPPKLSDAEMKARGEKAKALAARFKTETLG